MALPVTISGIVVSLGTVGPFKSSGGNFYFFGGDSTTGDNLNAMKATDPTSSFSSAGTVNMDVTSTAFGVSTFTAYQVGDVIHLAVGMDRGTTVVDYRYVTFDMSSDTFGTPEVIETNVDSRTSGTTIQRGISIVVRSDGTVVVLYNGARVANMGSSYSRIVYARRAAGGGWTTNVAVDAGGTTDYYNPEIALGASDRSHFFWSTSSGATHRTLTSANALQTAGNFSAGGSLASQPSAVSYNDTGTQRVVCSSPSFIRDALTFNSADDPTETNRTSVFDSNAARPVRLFVDGTDVWALFVNSANSDLYVQKSTNAGTTFAAAAVAFVATVTAADANISNDGAIYQRGSDFVIPYIVNDNGTLKYNEYVVRSVSSNKTLAAGAGSYAFTGTAASVLVKRKVAADAGSYAFTGQAATFRRNIPVVAGAGSYAFTGTAASVLHKWIVTAGAGSYAFTGTNANINKGQRLTADAGSYAFTGTAASLLHNWKIAAGAGSYQFTGTNATLRRNIPVVAGAGSYAFNGTAASVLHGWKIAAAAGSYSFSGSAASILHNWKLSAGVGSYSFTGTDATIVTAAAKTLVAGAGSYAFTGTAASILHNWKVAADTGSYAFSGTAANVLHGWKLAAGAGSYAFTGQAASILHAWKITADVGSYSFTGTNAALNKGIRLTADVGSYTFSGTAAGVALLRKIAADPGSYQFGGTDADISIAGSPTDDTVRRGTGGWGAGLNARRRRDYSPPIPLSQRDRKLSDLDQPVIVKASVTTPAQVLKPLIDDEQDLADLMDLQDLGLLN